MLCLCKWILSMGLPLRFPSQKSCFYFWLRNWGINHRHQLYLWSFQVMWYCFSLYRIVLPERRTDFSMTKGEIILWYFAVDPNRAMLLESGGMNHPAPSRSPQNPFFFIFWKFIMNLEKSWNLGPPEPFFHGYWIWLIKPQHTLLSYVVSNPSIVLFAFSQCWRILFAPLLFRCS